MVLSRRRFANFPLSVSHFTICGIQLVTMQIMVFCSAVVSTGLNAALSLQIKADKIEIWIYNLHVFGKVACLRSITSIFTLFTQTLFEHANFPFGCLIRFSFHHHLFTFFTIFIVHVLCHHHHCHFLRLRKPKCLLIFIWFGICSSMRAPAHNRKCSIHLLFHLFAVRIPKKCTFCTQHPQSIARQINCAVHQDVLQH